MIFQVCCFITKLDEHVLVCSNILFHLYSVNFFMISQPNCVPSHAQVLSSLRAWVHWLSQLYGQQFVQVFPGGTQTHQHQDTCHTINKQMLVAATSILNVGVSLTQKILSPSFYFIYCCDGSDLS